MKRLMTGIAMMAGLFMLSCNKLKNLANININIPYSYSVSVPDYVDTVQIPVGASAMVSIPAVPIATHSKETLEEYNTSAAKIVSLKLKSLSVQITKPAGSNFDFADAMSAYISARGLPEIMVASKYYIAKGQSTLDLDCAQDDLRSYFLSDTMYVRLEGKFNNVPKPNTTFNTNAVFTLKANPLN